MMTGIIVARDLKEDIMGRGGILETSVIVNVDISAKEEKGDYAIK